MRLSIYSTILLYVLLLLPAINVSSQSISVNPDYTPEQLVKEVFFGNSSCITVENIIINGKDFGSGEKSFGYFSRESSDFAIENGIILSTGKISGALGPNSYIQSTKDNPLPTWGGDSDLENSLQVDKSHDATILEFDFIANNTNYISFEYLFASEQYLLDGRIEQCNYTDGFAFLIRRAGTSDYYHNLAVIPHTSTPIKSNTVRGPGGLCPPVNAEYFGQYNDSNSATNFNGQTKILTAETIVTPGERYHLKIVIADQGNSYYDSAVFLKAGSFTGRKDLGPDLIKATNNPVCEGSSKILDATTAGATSYQWFKDGVIILGATNPLLNVLGAAQNSGVYEVQINISGCALKGSIKVEIQEKPLLNFGTFPFCDSNLSGSIPVDFSKLDPQIISSFTSVFTPKYYLTKDGAQNGTDGTELKDGWLLTADTTIYVRIESALGCNPEFGEILLQIGAKTQLIRDAASDNVCDNDLDGSASVNLRNYEASFTNSSQVTVTYYNSQQDAKNKVNPISENQIINASKTFGIRFESANACPNVGTLTLDLKSPKKSNVLNDVIICKNATTTLDAGSGFSSYVWSNGETTSKITNVPVGEYWVDLGFNGCVYRQMVKVTSSDLPQITNIEVSGNTATIYATGGTAPYEYSLNNIDFQSSNLITGIPRGLQKVYVRDAQKCLTVEKEFLIINLINVITPNGDGFNDVLDYSDLKIKQNVSIQIFNRFGNLVFTSKDQQFIWDGKLNGRILPTANYWYILNWTEPDTQNPVSYKGWILLKNRN